MLKPWQTNAEVFCFYKLMFMPSNATLPQIHRNNLEFPKLAHWLNMAFRIDNANLDILTNKHKTIKE